LLTVNAILFDFDGVLADTEPHHHAAWNEALASFGIHVGWEEYRRDWVGVADSVMLESLGRRATPPKALSELKTLHPDKRRILQRRIAQVELISPELRRLLSDLDGFRLGVVTSSSRSEIEPILAREGVLGLFGACVYGDEVMRLKPDPEPYRTALERLGVRTALAVEDSIAGATSAQCAGCEVLQVEAAVEVVPRLRERLGLGNFR
jgi:HAD superfamily hydrolase (TIGR01509 family)